MMWPTMINLNLLIQINKELVSVKPITFSVGYHRK